MPTDFTSRLNVLFALMLLMCKLNPNNLELFIVFLASTVLEARADGVGTTSKTSRKLLDYSFSWLFKYQFSMGMNFIFVDFY